MATASCSLFVGTASAITNYARLGLATQNELPNILRELLFIKEPPHLLEAHLNNNSYLSRNLRAHEWNIIRTVRTNQYDEFDVPLMYKIIRNLNLVPRPTQGWDNQTPPLATEMTVGDDIERIRRIRNEVVHRGNTNVQDPELAKYFSVFKDLASRLEISLVLSNREFVSKIENVETCCIDNDTQQLYIRRLKELAENETQLVQSVAKVQKDLASLGLKITSNVSKLTGEIDEIKLEQMEVIPKNIRDQMMKDLEKWLQDDTKFVPTTASEYVFRCLKKENCVSVVGSPGVGKSAVTRHVALKMKEQGYTLTPITVPTDIRDFYQPGQQTVFIIDDMCGKFTANKQLIDTWKQLLGVVDNILSDYCKIIVSIRSQVYKDAQFCVLSQFRSCECNLISHNLLLSKDERKQIAKAHLGKQCYIPDAMLLKYDFFPLLCFLFSRQENMDINNFFNNPFVVFEKELNSLWNEGEVGQYKICGLALCVIYNNELDEKYLTSMESCVRDIIDDVCEACGINRGTSRIKIKEELDTLVGTYLKKENNIYITIHDKLFDFLVYFYGTKMLDCLIKHAMTDIINQRFRWNKFHNNEDKDTDEFISIIPDDKLTLYLNRLILDWSNGKLKDLFFDNYNMRNEQFRDLLITQLLYRDKAEQSQLSRIAETFKVFVIGSLEACCWRGYDNMLPWFVDQGVDINRCSTCSLTPLAFACIDNKIELINTLLNLGADINKQGLLGFTPLHISCDSEADQAVLDLLLKNKPCINKRRFDGATPLLFALYENNREAVKVLLSQSADCNIGLYDSQAIKDGIREAEKLTGKPFESEENYWLRWFSKRCQSSVVDYVNQEPTKITNIIGGATPLHLMCFRNDIDMIRLLLERNSDINIRKEDGSTPLFVACLLGFIDIATILLEHGANRDICRNDGTSPLDIAKQKNHFDIMFLLENPKWK
ncbi:Hypothetical predicted protein [Mytilus galloprovincialis]|uniref:DZIP3-like HEPN domain-containing protein n=1 Tax=Mytilus galloprovincialis TaxID=29158 RepID=A0A8B6EQF7_MYTGA|nr:Hypothetical predicted protein [Mytilus galloprovincialis]